MALGEPLMELHKWSIQWSGDDLLLFQSADQADIAAHRVVLRWSFWTEEKAESAPAALNRWPDMQNRFRTTPDVSASDSRLPKWQRLKTSIDSLIDLPGR